VTHDQVEAMTLADQIVVLDHGRVQQIGSPQEIYRNPVNSMVAGFLGNPPMNIIPVTYDGDRLLVFNNQSLQLNLARQLQLSPGQKFNLGIRPEHIQIHPTSAQNDHDCLVLEVDLVEPLGRETLIKAIVPGSNIRLNLLTDAQCPSREGDRLTVKFDLAHLFVFDVNNGRTVNCQ
jgi:multiple sugar transport system ATP-binding protein